MQTPLARFRRISPELQTEGFAWDVGLMSQVKYYASQLTWLDLLSGKGSPFILARLRVHHKEFLSFQINKKSLCK